MFPLTSGCGPAFIIQVCGKDMKHSTLQWYLFTNRTLLIKKHSPQSLSPSLPTSVPWLSFLRTNRRVYFVVIALQTVVLNNLTNTVGVSGLSPEMFHKATLFRAQWNVLLGHNQPFILKAFISHQFAKLWRNLFWGSKTSIQFFDGADGLIEFSLQERLNAFFVSHQVNGSACCCVQGQCSQRY